MPDSSFFKDNIRHDIACRQAWEQGCIPDGAKKLFRVINHKHDLEFYYNIVFRLPGQTEVWTLGDVSKADFDRDIRLGRSVTFVLVLHSELVYSIDYRQLKMRGPVPSHRGGDKTFYFIEPPAGAKAKKPPPEVSEMILEMLADMELAVQGDPV